MAGAAFFVQFVSLANSVEPISEVLTQNGLKLVQYTLQAIAGGAPRSYLGAFSDILAALNSHCVTSLSRWLEVGCCITGSHLVELGRDVTPLNGSVAVITPQRNH